MILVIGGRSKIGSALISELLARGELVRVLLRHVEDGGSPAGVERVVGDLGDPQSLAAAMTGVSRVFLLCGPTPDEVVLNRNAIDAAAEARVQLLVRSSILGSDPGSSATFVRDHGVCDDHLREVGVPYAIVRPNLFMQNVPEQTVPSIDSAGNFYANAGDAKVSMVDTRDVAAVAAVLLSEPGHVAGKLSATLGREISYVDVPDETLRGALVGFGLGDWMVAALVDLFQDYRRSGTDGYAARVTDTIERITGRPPRTLDALLAESST
jgi:uncharacterized protein YbjT (DUF2867 family)